MYPSGDFMAMFEAKVPSLSKLLIVNFYAIYPQSAIFYARIIRKLGAAPMSLYNAGARKIKFE